MNARPILVHLAKLLHEHGLEAILIGNAGAALQGAPVTTIDFDFFFRDTPSNLRKVKAIADSLGATVARPFLPSSEMVRIERKDEFLQVDFTSKIHGVKSFEGLRSRASRIDFDGYTLVVANLRDIISSKRAADRPRDRAVLYVLEETLNEKEKSEKKGNS